MYVWVDTTELSGDLLKAAQSTHIKKWLENMQYAFGQKSRTVQAMFNLRQVAEREPEVWEALLSLSKFDGYEEGKGGGDSQSCVKETKPEGIWEKPTGKKAPRWQAGMKNLKPSLF